LPASYLTGLFLLETLQIGRAGVIVALLGISVAGGLVFYVVARSAIGAILAGVGLPIALAAFVIMTFSQDRSQKYPKGPVTSIEPLTKFSDFPVYWLGRTYRGLDLTEIHTQTERSRGPAHTVLYLTYGYGVCSNRGFDSHCTSTPILLILEPACAVPRIHYGSQGSPDSYVWTADVSVRTEGRTPPAKPDLLRDLSLVNVSKFPDVGLVDSKTYDAKFRARCGD
jgi:hypothetical protein